MPIYLAGLGPQMTRLAGRISDGVFINMATPEKIREIAGRTQAAATAAGRGPVDVIGKVRVSLNPDREVARSKLRQALTFYNIADHYSDMLREQGFVSEVDAVQEAFRSGGFKAAMGALTDDYMDRLPVIPATSVAEIKDRLAPYVEAGVTRMVVPYVPVSEPRGRGRRALHHRLGAGGRRLTAAGRYDHDNTNMVRTRKARRTNV